MRCVRWLLKLDEDDVAVGPTHQEKEKRKRGRDLVCNVICFIVDVLSRGWWPDAQLSSLFFFFFFTSFLF